jgi:uncharacterized OsmC-like protein
MTQTATTITRTAIARNGVDTPTLFATLDAVKAQRELAKFQFRAKNRWISGTHSQSTIGDFFGAGGEQQREKAFRLDGDHPRVLVGDDHGPSPVEYVLHALATCLTAGIANIAAARGIDLTEVESTVEGDIDLSGVFGMDHNVRNGYQGIKISFRVKGNASDEKLAGLVAQSKARSAVLDILTNGVPVDVQVSTEGV